ncbi:MAG TPA: hypothetical protein VFZ34_20735 [Blastocatellia bacterium]|nr:hypothetical protein [Blastocatellia bacterium]
MKRNTTILFLLTLIWALITVPLRAATTPLQPGGSITVDCNLGNVLTKKKTIATGSQAVAARLTMSLDSTGTVLTINLQNTATTPDAVLYAIDLGLPNRFVAVNRMEASFSGFPAGARWHGPTDIAGPTNAIGTSTFAAREVMASRMDDYLPRQKSLSAGFLRTGQSGRITVKITLTAEARQKPLLLNPVAYFLVNDPNSPGNRMQIASLSAVR